MSAYLLNLIIFLPLAVGLVLLALPAKLGLHRQIALGTAALTLLGSLAVWQASNPEASGLQLVTQLAWIPFLGIDYHIGVDGISLFLVVLTSLFTLLAMLYSWSLEQQPGRFFALLLILESGLLGTVLAANLFLFYVFWELMLLPMFFLIGIWGGQQRIKAVLKFVIYTMAGSLVLLLSILYLGTQYHAQTGQWSFEIAVLTQLQLPPTPIVDLLFVGFALAFLIKVPVFPLHTWLPDTYCEAPPVVTFMLSGVMAKMGVYGLLRITLPLFPDSLARLGPVLSLLAIAGIIYGAILALGQVEIKRLLAYSSVSHLGLIALGVFTWNLNSIEGVVYHMVSHAVATGGLFLLAGVLESHYGTTRIDQLGGIAARAPLYTVLFMLLTFASIGVPGLNGFIGEFLILLGVSSASAGLTLLAALTLILSAAYMLWLTQRFLFGPEAQPEHPPLRLPALQLAAIAPLCLLAIVMGLYTLPFTRHISPAVQDLIQNNQGPVQVLAPEVPFNPTPSPLEKPVHG